MHHKTTVYHHAAQALV